MTLAEEKQALKNKLKQIDNRSKKAPKYTKDPKDVLADIKKTTKDTQEEKDARAQRKKTGNYFLNDFNFISTLGTGTFGRVRLVKHRDDPPEVFPLALKCLKNKILFINIITFKLKKETKHSP